MSKTPMLARNQAIARWLGAGTVETMHDHRSPSDQINAITVYTDGAAKGNPGPAGWCWWISEHSWATGGWSRATNNVAELTAVREILVSLDPYPHIGLTIVTDSKYAMDSLTKWVHGWRRNGWKTKTGGPVANSELISSVDELLRARRGQVDWLWQRGHVGAAGNTEADAGASAAAVAFKNNRPHPAGPGLSGITHLLG